MTIKKLSFKEAKALVLKGEKVHAIADNICLDRLALKGVFVFVNDNGNITIPSFPEECSYYQF